MNPQQFRYSNLMLVQLPEDIKIYMSIRISTINARLVSVVMFVLLPPLASLLWLNPCVPLVRVPALGRAIVVGASVVFAGQTVISLFRCHLYPPLRIVLVKKCAQ